MTVYFTQEVDPSVCFHMLRGRRFRTRMVTLDARASATTKDLVGMVFMCRLNERLCRLGP